jgi:hypothetical protein
MCFKAIFYREIEIAKKYCVNFSLSYFSNVIFVVILSLLFDVINFFPSLDQRSFLFISYTIVIIQSQIFCQIYDFHDKKERIFEYLYLTFRLRLTSLISRFTLVLFLNITFLLIFYFASSFVFNDIFQICLFVLSISIIIYNSLSINCIISNGTNKLIGYFLQILLIPINFSAFLILEYQNNLALWLFSVFFAVLNGIISAYFTKCTV